GRVTEAEAMLAEMASIQDQEWPALAALYYRFIAVRVAGAGSDFDLLRDRIDDLDRLAGSVDNIRFKGIVKFWRLTWAVGIGDAERALEFGPIVLDDPFYRGSPTGLASAKQLYAAALMLAGRLDEVPGLLDSSLDGGRLVTLQHARALDMVALYA